MFKKPIPVFFGKEGNAALDSYVEERLTYLKSQLRNLHETKVPEWRKGYRGTPKEPNKTFPWPNASNLVVQVIGSHVDTLRARVLGSIFYTPPLYIASLVGEWTEQEKGEDQREVFEEFMNLVGIEPQELDLYRVLSTGFGEAIKFGSCFFKVPWLTEVEYERVGYSADTDKLYTKYDGPRPEKLTYEDFGAEPTAATLPQTDFKYHRQRLNKFDLLDRMNKGVYDKNAIASILSKPDRSTRTRTETESLQDQGIDAAGMVIEAEWDIYECHFSYWHNSKKYRIIYTYHQFSKTKLRAVFNFYPKEIEIFEHARLSYDGEDGLFGFGFAEMLTPYQEETSTTHNQRMDANTLANTSVLRVGGQSKLDGIFSLYPGAILPGAEGELEMMNVGRAPSDSVNYERLTLDLAKDRAGVGPASSGSGSGVTNPKKGIYSAMGSFSVMQEQNSRVSINTTDMRYAHVKLGRIFALQYANFGIGDRAKLFGKKQALLEKALKNIKDGRLALQIKAATASINKELEKQNDMLLTNVLKQHYMGIAQIMEALQNPNMPPEMQDYLKGVIKASHYLMHGILRNFSHDDTSRLLPLPESLKGVIDGNSTNNTEQAGGNPEGTSGGNGVQPDNSSQEGANASTLPVNGMGSVPAIPTGNSADGASHSGVQ
jgi:hypothetical protein